MINKIDLRKAISSIAISNAKRNTIYKAFSDLDSITKEEFDSVKSDISKVVESMLTKDAVGKANGVASLDSNCSVPIEQLGNIDTKLFLIVRELPTTDIQSNKIYLVPNQDGQGNNVYIEYLYVEDVWEKLGEFKPEVDLSHIEAKLDNKADLDKTKNVKVEQLTPAITYDEDNNNINGMFDCYKLGKFNSIVKNDNPDNGWQYYDFGYRIDDDFVPQYIYDDTADEHIEITATTYLDDINDGDGGYAFNTAKPLDLTHDLYLDNEQTGIVSRIFKSDIDKDTVKNSIIIGGYPIDASSETDIEYSIIFQALNGWGSSNTKIKNSIIFNAGNSNKPIPNNANVTDNIILSTQGDSINKDKCVLIGHCKTKTNLTEGSVLIGQNDIAENACISIGCSCNTKGGIVIGKTSYAGRSSVTIGNFSNTRIFSPDAISIGFGTWCNTNSVAIGSSASALSEQSVSIGYETACRGKFSISIGNAITSNTVSNPSIKIGKFANPSATNDYGYYYIGGYKDDTTYYNIEETLTYNNQHKKYIYGIGGYDGTNSATEGIKSLQEVLADKADASAVPTKVSQLINDSNFATPNDNAIFAGLTIHNNAKIRYIQRTDGDEGTYLLAENPADRVANKVYSADGNLFDVGKLVKNVQCNVSGDANNIEFGYTTVDGTYNFSVVPTVTTNHAGIMTAADKVKLDSLPSITSKLVNITTASTAEEVVTKFNALLADLKAKGYMEADTPQ